MKTQSALVSYYESTLKYLQSNEAYIKKYHPFPLSNNYVSKSKENGLEIIQQSKNNKFTPFVNKEYLESNMANLNQNRGGESDNESLSEKSTSHQSQNEQPNLTINNTPLNLYQLSTLNRPLFVPSKYTENERGENESSSDRTSTSTSKKDENENDEPDYLVQMFGRKGWVCKLCHNFNYETRTKCNRCKVLRLPENILGYKFKKKSHEEGDSKGKKNGRERKKNDWFCVNCRNLNYAFRKVCNRCKAPKICYSINNLLTYSMMNYNNIDMSVGSDCLLYKPLFEPNMDL